MFCPNCGQQQPADSTKYCPRCGTLIAGLAQWLAAAGNASPAVREAPPAPAAGRAPLSPRRKGMRRGGKLMFLSAVLLPFLIAFSAAIEEGAPIALSFILFFIGLSLMLYARIFGDDTPAAAKTAPPQMHAAAANALPPAAADARAQDFARRGVRTSELSHPPSVTEHTTRFLKDE